MKKWLAFNFFLILFLGFSTFSYAESLDTDRIQLVKQEISLLKDRLQQATAGLEKLKNSEKKIFALTEDQVNKQMLAQSQLDIAVAKSNLDSVGIELTESQQTLSRLNDELEEVKNHLKVAGIFGNKLVQLNQADVVTLNNQYLQITQLLSLEKNRSVDLEQLKAIANQSLSLYEMKYQHLHELLKSQTVLQLKEEQTQSELVFQEQQSMWLQKLNRLNAQLVQLQHDKNPDKALYAKLDADIFYTNENVNLSYLQMLIARYHDQIKQLSVSLTHSVSVGVLNNMSAQTDTLRQQLTRLDELLKERITILEKRKQLKHLQLSSGDSGYIELKQLNQQYTDSLQAVSDLTEKLMHLRGKIDQDLQQELSSRQGFPGLDLQAWLDLGAKVSLIPMLGLHVLKNVMINLKDAANVLSLGLFVFFIFLEAGWIAVFYYVNKSLKKIISHLSDHDQGHINLKWLFVKLLNRNVIDLAVIGNLVWIFYFCDIPLQALLSLSFVWLLFKTLILISRLYLVETVHEAVVNIALYRRLRAMFVVGGLVTVLVVGVHDLPVSYEVKDLFARLFLLFVLVASFILLRSSEVIPALIIPHLREHRLSFIRIIRFLSIFIPLVLLVNAAVGLLGFVNLVYIISWYEGVFLLVLAGYLILRDLLVDLIDLLSTVLIRHVSNGWLWTEAFLKPISKVLKIVLFLSAWVLLFIVYGWDRQSPVVERLHKLAHYQIGQVLNTFITPISIIKLLVIISLLYWAAKWTREFVYRLLLKRTQDMGIRNSIAILSQYAMIVIGILFGLRVLGVDFAALTFVASAFALSVGFGLRDLANNFICGFLLLIERPIKIGDIVTINDHEGEVIHIGSRAVTIRTGKHVEVVIPNAEIFGKTFMNWTAKDNIVRSQTIIGVDQYDDPMTVKKIIIEILTTNKNILKEPPPEVLLRQLTNGVSEFEVRYHVNLKLIKSRDEVLSEVLVAIWNEFDRQGIRPAYPTREIYVKTGAHA